jgi:hypothetical protein
MKRYASVSPWHMSLCRRSVYRLQGIMHNEHMQPIDMHAVTHHDNKDCLTHTPTVDLELHSCWEWSAWRIAGRTLGRWPRCTMDLNISAYTENRAAAVHRATLKAGRSRRAGSERKGANDAGRGRKLAARDLGRYLNCVRMIVDAQASAGRPYRPNRRHCEGRAEGKFEAQLCARVCHRLCIRVEAKASSLGLRIHCILVQNLRQLVLDAQWEARLGRRIWADHDRRGVAK